MFPLFKIKRETLGGTFCIGKGFVLSLIPTYSLIFHLKQNHPLNHGFIYLLQYVYYVQYVYYIHTYIYAHIYIEHMYIIYHF